MSDPLRALAPAGLELPGPLLVELRAACASPGRFYHDESHVLDVARQFAAASRARPWQAPREVYLAVLFHDAVYVPGAADNEVRSAQLADRALSRWCAGAGLAAQRVRELILLTARHGALEPADVGADAAHFLDCDMAILGTRADVFDAYERAIAAEYRGVPPQLYAAGRRAFLGRLLAKERIFLSELFHRRLDAPARANLRRALGRLAPQEPAPAVPPEPVPAAPGRRRG